MEIPLSISARRNQTPREHRKRKGCNTGLAGFVEVSMAGVGPHGGLWEDSPLRGPRELSGVPNRSLGGFPGGHGTMSKLLVESLTSLERTTAHAIDVPPKNAITWEYSQ